MTNKRPCTRCGEVLPEEAFPFHKQRPALRLKECSQCHEIRRMHPSARPPKPWKKCPGARGMPCGRAIRNRERSLCGECYRKDNRPARPSMARGVSRATGKPTSSPFEPVIRYHHDPEEYMHNPKLASIRLR